MFGRRKRLSYNLGQSIQLDTKLSDMSFTVFDTETTGFSISKDDRLIEIGAVQVEHLQVTDRTFQTFTNPNRDIPESITQLTSIEQKHVENAPTSFKAIKNFFQFVEENQSSGWVGHHLNFDRLVIAKELQRASYSYNEPSTFDTFDLIDYLIPACNQRDLEEYADIFDTQTFERHRALGDAMTTAHLFVELLKRLEQQGITTLAHLLRLKNGKVQREIAMF
ncbi:3'-5' exonuclease [Sporosarcina sp. Marseille-Q4063]|uniref:3'-5' exonuclease n=1 Tax=Sporosarcina sp. Marseille-Q4063 TaxID=2810514 RepID=UPI001BAEA0F6|nr:exonuclease domain-containing protein [Sporosarcina sp. Marseille-Q4063]QUW20718.1 3'-5' exonuclease [Sporosarcina sp. Marseille-Q4063]